VQAQRGHRVFVHPIFTNTLCSFLHQHLPSLHCLCKLCNTPAPSQGPASLLPCTGTTGHHRATSTGHQHGAKAAARLRGCQPPSRRRGQGSTKLDEGIAVQGLVCRLRSTIARGSPAFSVLAILASFIRKLVVVSRLLSRGYCQLGTELGELCSTRCK